jgi:hypothetical protein
MQNSKFVGVCVLISSLIVSVAIVYHAKASGRYQIHVPPSSPPSVIWVVDTTTGEVKIKACP